MKRLHTLFVILVISAFVVSGCTATPPQDSPAEPDSVNTNSQEPVTNEPANEEQTNEPSSEVTKTEPVPEEVEIAINPEDFIWDQDYITEVPPIMMIDPYFQIFGQSQGAVPYTYETAVKLSGHSCGATAGAWTITRKALEVLYPGGEIPVRGQIYVEAPGSEEQFPVGVFGEVIAYITGASPKTGFIGAEFGQANDIFVRQNKMVYTEAPTETMPPQMEWVFTRLDTGAKVGVKFNLAVILPVATPEQQEMGRKMAAGNATPEEAAAYSEYWNARAEFVFDNADTMDGFFLVTVYQEPTPTTADAIVNPETPSAQDFAWEQDYITEVEPIMMYDPYFSIFGQSQTAVPYYYEEVVKVAGHSCGATTGAWIITQKALEVLYPDGEIPVRGMIAVEAPGAEDEWFVGVFGDIITYLTGAAPHSGFIGQEFGQTDDVFVRQNKMVYADEPTNQLPPMREWIFTRLDTGAKVGVRFNLVIITPIPTPGRIAMGKTMATFQATPDEAADYIQYWNDRAVFVLENQDLIGFFIVTVYD